MPSMTEDLGRIADCIAASRRERMEAAAERRREVASRHRAVGRRLHEIKTSREKMSREQHRHAAAVLLRRVAETDTMLRLFHRSRRELAAEQRGQAAAFMRDLTGRVADLRDAFSAAQQARVTVRQASSHALHGQLRDYRQDRHDADAAWRGMPARQAHRPAAQHRAGGAPAPHAGLAGFEPEPSEPGSRPGRHRSTSPS
jgi:hypothetical protein